MAEIHIPRATETSVILGFPKSVLHVRTDLARGPASVDAGPRHDMLVAISKRVAAEGLDGYCVHWSGGTDADCT
jgi:hypothetical protein